MTLIWHDGIDFYSSEALREMMSEPWKVTPLPAIKDEYGTAYEVAGMTSIQGRGTVYCIYLNETHPCDFKDWLGRHFTANGEVFVIAGVDKPAVLRDFHKGDIIGLLRRIDIE